MSSFESRRARSQLSTDWIWGGAGISLATASASFAGYMILTAPAQVTGFGSKDFGIFAQFDRRNPAQMAARTPSPGRPPVASSSAPPLAPPPALQTAAATPEGATLPAAPSAGIDFTPTGSVPDAHDVSQVPRVAGALDAFHLRDVVGNRALIEHQSRLSLVKPGSILAGAGEVLSIERQGDGWIVRTASGVIGGS